MVLPHACYVRGGVVTGGAEDSQCNRAAPGSEFHPPECSTRGFYQAARSKKLRRHAKRSKTLRHAGWIHAAFRVQAIMQELQSGRPRNERGCLARQDPESQGLCLPTVGLTRVAICVARWSPSPLVGVLLRARQEDAHVRGAFVCWMAWSPPTHTGSCQLLPVQIQPVISACCRRS